MSKYIDADKLKAEIKHLKLDVYDEAHQFDLGARSSLTFLESLIASLQQEQQEPTCKTCGFYENNCPFTRGKLMVYPNYVCKDYTYSAMKAHEQPQVADTSKMEQEVDLEKEAQAYSFNIESMLFSQLSKEQQILWKKEIEQAFLAGQTTGMEWQEQLDADLEKDDIIDYIHEHFYYDKDFDGYGHGKFRPVFTREDLIKIARHFYELGKNSK